MWNGQTELKMGWKEGWMGIFIGECKTSGKARRRGGGRPRLRLYRFPVARMRESIIRFHIFFFSPLCIFSPIFLPPPSVSVLLFTVATTADICVAVIEQHCFGKNLFHGIVRPRCNCAVLMSEEDVRWYRNVDFRMIDDEM